ncbi:MAG: hypothetical protein PHT60_13250 [Acidiphilium sp.]|nr:hypothetical protein [Acidiphilium sp.]MDD4936729.1 hypothetical protein [Acidiphilium sp.]
MQWMFLVLAALSALVELHTGTFYLAVVSVVALLTAVLGFFVPESALLWLFLGICVVSLPLVRVWRKRLLRGKSLPDFDVGHEVMITGAQTSSNRILATYRGTQWDAVMDDGTKPSIGTIARIVGKTDNVLHLSAVSGGNHHPPAQETP